MVRTKWTEESLKEAVNDSTSIMGVVRKLGLSPKSAGNWETVKKHILRLELDTTHFQPRNTDTLRAIAVNTRSDNEVFIENSPASRATVRRRLIKERGRKCETETCGITEWLGQPITLELEHINGISNDHRKSNLLLLCPNCHSNTTTWRGRKNKKVNRCNCGEIISKEATNCRSCSQQGKPTKIVWPANSILQEMVNEIGYVGVGKQLGVSDNAVRKHLKN